MASKRTKRSKAGKKMTQTGEPVPQKAAPAIEISSREAGEGGNAIVDPKPTPVQDNGVLAPSSPAEEQVWAQIDHDRVALKVAEASLEFSKKYDQLHSEISRKWATDPKAWEQCIEHTQLEAARMAVWLEPLDQIYEDVWEKKKTPALVRAVLRWGILPAIDKTSAEAQTTLSNLNSTLKTPCDLTVLLRGLESRAEMLKSDWCKRVAFEVEDIELAQQIASPKELNPLVWERLRSDFIAMAREEKEIVRARSRDLYLRADVNYVIDPKAKYGCWHLHGAFDEDFKAKFELAATVAGRALGPPSGITPYLFWLHNVSLDLMKNNGRDQLFAWQKGKSWSIKRPTVASGTYCARLAKLARESVSVETWGELFESVFLDGSDSAVEEPLQSLGAPESDEEIWDTLPHEHAGIKVGRGLIEFAEQGRPPDATAASQFLAKQQEEIRLTYDAYIGLLSASKQMTPPVLGCIYRKILLPAIKDAVARVKSTFRVPLVFDDTCTFSRVVGLAHDFRMFSSGLELRIADDAMTSELNHNKPVALCLADSDPGPRKPQTGADGDSAGQTGVSEAASRTNTPLPANPRPMIATAVTKFNLLDFDVEHAKLLVIIWQTRHMGHLEVCKRLDSEDVRPLGRWFENFKVTKWEDAYRHSDCQSRVQKRISTLRKQAELSTQRPRK
jgi:hypothetical protein